MLHTERELMVIKFVVVPTRNFVVIEHTRMSRLKIVKCRSCTHP